MPCMPTTAIPAEICNWPATTTLKNADRILMTNLFDQQRFPALCFGGLYHQRWRIEEAFKRLKHRLNLEHVSGLFQPAVGQDVATKIVCDNLQALTALTALTAHTALKPLLPLLLRGGAIGRKLGSLAAQSARPDRRTNLPSPGKPFKTSRPSAKTS